MIAKATGVAKATPDNDALIAALKSALQDPKPSTKVLVTPEQLNQIGLLLGAAVPRDGQELVDLIKSRISIFLPALDLPVALLPEDLTALKDQFMGTGYTNYEQYCKDTVQNAMAFLLHGCMRDFEAV